MWCPVHFSSGCSCRWALTLAALCLSGCSSVPGALPPSDPCSLENPARLAFVLECDAKIDQCPRMPDGTARPDCPALVECERQQAKECG